VAAAGAGGQILASATTLEAAGDTYAVSDPRPMHLKGLAEQVDIVEVAWR
jgi:class 3 adenylate cyclase